MVGRDFTTLVMVNPKDMAVVMTCRCNQSNAVLIVDLVMNLLTRFPRSIFIPERNKAATLMDVLIDRIKKETSWNPFVRIFNKFVNDKKTSKQHDITLGSVRKQFGFGTTGDSRKLLYSDVLMTTAERNYNRIFDKIIIDEIGGLVVRNGRVDHAVVGHDDSLIAYLIACWFIMYAQNIGLYGIKSNEILPIQKDGYIADDRNESTKERVSYLQTKLKSSTLPEMMRRAFEYELKELLPIAGKNKCIDADVVSMHQLSSTAAVKASASPKAIGNTLSSLFR
jgi:hypothetical protein